MWSKGYIQRQQLKLNLQNSLTYTSNAKLYQNLLSNSEDKNMDQQI
jgi:hypothetical protein